MKLAVRPICALSAATGQTSSTPLLRSTVLASPIDRMRMISEGRARGELLSLLRRESVDVAKYLPAPLVPLGFKFERLLVAARVRAPTGRVLLLLLCSPLVLFLAIVFAILVTGGVISAGRIVLFLFASRWLMSELPTMLTPRPLA